MAYNNLIKRFYISIFFIAIYCFVSLFYFESIIYFILIIYFLILIEVYLYFNKFKKLIFAYLIISLISLYLIEFNYEFFFKFNLLVIIVISFDIFSYVIGVILGKNKFLPYLSPNKTIEGFLGGAFFSFFFTFLFCFVFNLDINLKLFIFTVIIIISAFIGDLIESLFKRLNNLKNSSNFLPGHGGFFDRFDSFVFSVIMYSITVNLL